MNSCILMAEIIQEPQLRYTPDNQTPIAEILVQFPGARPEDPLATLKVVGWGNLATEIQERYHVGDRIAIEGRLSMNTIERPEGFKEKRAELTASRIHSLGADAMKSSAPTSTSIPNNVVPLASRSQGSGSSRSVDPAPKATSTSSVHPFPTTTTQTPPPDRTDRTDPVYGNESESSDDIPF